MTFKSGDSHYMDAPCGFLNFQISYINLHQIYIQFAGSVWRASIERHTGSSIYNLEIINNKQILKLQEMVVRQIFKFSV